MKALFIRGLRELGGRWRIFWYRCPKCNSDAPEVDTCGVCFDYRGEYPPSDNVLYLWWIRYVDWMEKE